LKRSPSGVQSHLAMKNAPCAPLYYPVPARPSPVRWWFTLVALVWAFSATGCDRNEKTALEEFKKDVAALKAWSDEKEKSFAGNPMAALAAVGEMTTKCKAIKTDGLPADLKEAWAKNLVAMEKMAALMGEMPANPEEAQKKMADPAFQKDFGVKMLAIQQEVMSASTKMDELSKKYGFESLGKK
jgi:hypothetical protein